MTLRAVFSRPRLGTAPGTFRVLGSVSALNRTWSRPALAAKCSDLPSVASTVCAGAGRAYSPARTHPSGGAPRGAARGRRRRTPARFHGAPGMRQQRVEEGNLRRDAEESRSLSGGRPSPRAHFRHGLVRAVDVVVDVELQRERKTAESRLLLLALFALFAPPSRGSAGARRLAATAREAAEADQPPPGASPASKVASRSKPGTGRHESCSVRVRAVHTVTMSAAAVAAWREGARGEGMSASGERRSVARRMSPKGGWIAVRREDGDRAARTADGAREGEVDAP